MTSTFESSVRQINAPQYRVFETLSNLENLEHMKHRLPADKVAGLSFDRDSIGINVPMAGDIRLRIVDRVPPKTIKFEAEKSPMPFNFWIQLVPLSEVSCKMRLVIKAELNPFIKGMVQKPLEAGIEKIADALQNMQY